MPDGSTYILKRPASETADEYVEMEFVLPPECLPPPPHIHTQGAEEYEVIEGSFDVMVDGSWGTLGPGESASVPKGAMHTFRNRSGDVVRVQNWHRPGMRFDEFIERMHQVLGEVGVKSKRDPRALMCLSMVMLDFPDTLVPARRRDRIPVKAMAGLGRLFRLAG